MINFQSYQHMANRTAKRQDFAFDLQHVALGLTGEAGEFADAAKKHLIYGAKFDHENAVEEIGDILWYCALACSVLGVDMGQVAKANILKLKRRYPDKYTDDHAALRLDKERE